MSKYINKILLILCCIFFVIFCFLLRRNHQWKDELSLMSRYAGTLEALNDYKKGNLRIYKIIYDGKREFSGKKEGVFEVWYEPCYLILGKPHIFQTKVFTTAYNSKMKYMHQHPERFSISMDNTSK
ncbi:MAG: hypothetical protein JRE23_14050 [Deltaproteobacteria bacterium]|nr:hypothetical protein [Deltaproteobacteria bacterium]